MNNFHSTCPESSFNYPAYASAHGKYRHLHTDIFWSATFLLGFPDEWCLYYCLRGLQSKSLWEGGPSEPQHPKGHMRPKYALPCRIDYLVTSYLSVDCLPLLLAGCTGRGVAQGTLEWARRNWSWPLKEARGQLDGVHRSLRLCACSSHRAIDTGLPDCIRAGALWLPLQHLIKSA